ncbi:coiled-coil domain-containing protein 96 [Rhineura floridana]|uniref:coiled-coil domain-containing protein 96 n=1 Tax=Rhineura floridana TaxID=261503 RepID=UPI002AC84A46|nr:coiled-coil domain-containing protein 96 [Rhineura floridana]
MMEAEGAVPPIPTEPAEVPEHAATAEVVEDSRATGTEEAPLAVAEAAAEVAAAAELASEGERMEPVAEEPPASEEAGEGTAADEEEPPPPDGAASSDGAGGGEGEEEEEGEGGPAPPPAIVESVVREAPSNISLRDELPTSASFTEVELLEPPPLQVGVELGRRISLSLRELEQRRLSGASLDVGSSLESDEVEEAEAETEQQREQRLAQEQRHRAELIEQYRQLVAERSRLHIYNTKLQGKLGELLNKAKGKERARAELEQHISDKEQRYSRYLAMLDELRNQQADEVTWFQKQIDAAQGSCHEKLTKVEREWKAYQAVKKEVAVYTMGRRLGGKQAAIQEVDQIQAREQSKEKEMTEVHLENIKLKHRIQKLEVSLKAQEELAEGLHLIDFEQLKIENQTYNEKIEERNEELLKLRRKITNTVQVLTQVKEKLQFVEAENHGKKTQLMAIEALVAQKRDLLTKTKQARDKLRMDNQRLCQKCGLLGNALLLRDFESKVAAAEILNDRLEVLKRHHAALSLTCKGVKKKIRGVRSFLPL